MPNHKFLWLKLLLKWYPFLSVNDRTWLIPHIRFWTANRRAIFQWKIVKKKFDRCAQSFFLIILPLGNYSAIPGSKSDVWDEPSAIIYTEKQNIILTYFLNSFVHTGPQCKYQPVSLTQHSRLGKCPDADSICQKGLYYHQNRPDHPFCSREPYRKLNTNKEIIPF